MATDDAGFCIAVVVQLDNGPGDRLTQRGECIAKHGLTPDLADEAWIDPNRLVINPDPSSVSGRTIRVVGWSITLARIVTVIALPDGDVVWA